jgi:hypothetical protein
MAYKGTCFKTVTLAGVRMCLLLCFIHWQCLLAFIAVVEAGFDKVAITRYLAGPTCCCCCQLMSHCASHASVEGPGSLCSIGPASAAGIASQL